MKKKICISLMAAFAVLLTVSAYFLISHKVDENTQAEKYESIAEIVAQPDETAEPILLTEDKTLLSDYSELYFQNTDMVGWITVSDTNINYPVMQSVDNPNFYLKHGFDKSYSDYGCPYIQENCDVKLPSDNLIIYGHHMNNGSMFADLMKYESKDFFDSHKTVEFNTLTDKQSYEIVAVFKTVAYSQEGFRYYDFVNADTAEEFDSYIAKCKALELYDIGIEAEYGDKLITLSTCEYSRNNGRMVVVAKLITEDGGSNVAGVDS
ncbi:MAG TPA: sortase [Clostridiales bacterium]|nr:sortase [Clostridiales bacterium]